jgi:excinuclease UvrABC ATPase subunit
MAAVVAQGTPDEVMRDRRRLTGQYLSGIRPIAGAGRAPPPKQRQAG